MSPRLRHSAVSFAIVLVAYWIYALIAVPLIEPSIAGPSGSIGIGNRLEPVDDQRVKQLAGLFSPGDWELDNPKILENDSFILFLKDYDNTLDNSRIKLNRCTMVYLWDGPAEDEVQRLRQSVILKSAQGAILKFDKPMELTRMGKLIGGQLLGPITISSQGKTLSPDDDLLIYTSDVQLTEKEVWTPNPVKFTWGKNFGNGRDMHIKLLADPSNAGSDIATPQVKGVEIFEIRHIEQLHLEAPPDANVATTAQPNANVKPTNALMSPAINSDLPVEITCRGAFIFNVVKRVATFSDHVDVVRINPNGPSDQIQCEQLSIFFTPRDKSKPDSDSMSDMEPERIEARGYPVDINAPKENIKGRGERLEYNLKTNVIALDGGPEVFLRQGPNEIHAKNLRYQSLGPNRLGIADAQGPGYLCGQMDNKPDQRLEARWQGKLQLRPKDQNHLISFTGGAVLDYAGTVGHMEANEIYFWLKEGPPTTPTGKPKIDPDRMMAVKNVVLNSAQMSAAVDQMEVWFEKANSPQDIRWKNENNGQTSQGQGTLYAAKGTVPFLSTIAARRCPQKSGQSPNFVQPAMNVVQTGWHQDAQQRTVYRQPLNVPNANPNYIAATPRQYQTRPGQKMPVQRSGQQLPQSRMQPTPKYPGYLPRPPVGQPIIQNQNAIPPANPIFFSAPPNTNVSEQSLSAQGIAPKQHIKVTGRLLRARIQIREQKDAALSEIMIEDGVRLEETQTTSPNEQPILIQGDRLHGTDVSGPTAKVEVTGSPAHFEGRNLGLTGSNINLNRATNCLWIDGPGRMDMPIPQSDTQTIVPGQQTTASGTLVIEWKKKMLFNGSSAKFEESVSAATPNMHLATELLEVQLKRPVNFSDPNFQKQTQDQNSAENLLCQGGVFFETHDIDEQQQPISYIRLKTADLAVNVQTGALSAGGPGWLNSVNLVQNDQQNQLGPAFLVGRPPVPGSNNNPTNTSQPTNQLVCLHVRFQGSITGNRRQGELTFNDKIRSAYSPVLDWSAMLDLDNRENLGSQAVTLDCNHLKINQMPIPGSNKKTFEVEAKENAVVEGSLMQQGNFTARAYRINYANAKDQLILMGDGRTDAELFRQVKPGTETYRVAMQKLTFYPKTNKLEVDNARYLELNNLKLNLGPK